MDIDNFFRLFDRDQKSNEMEDAYLIEGLIPRKGIGVLIGATGAGKTQFATRLAACIATQTPIAKFNTDKCLKKDTPPNFGAPLKGATLYFAGEGQYHLPDRIEAVEGTFTSEQKSLLPEERIPILLLLRTYKRLNSVDQIDMLARSIEEERVRLEIFDLPIRLVIFDTLGMTFEIQDENNNSQMQDVVTILNRISDMFNCFVLVIAHPPKKKSAQGITRGASALTNSADLILELQKVNKSNIRKLVIEKMRDSPYEKAEAFFKVEAFDKAPAIVPYQREVNVGVSDKSKNEFNRTQHYIFQAFREREYPMASRKVLREFIIKMMNLEQASGALNPLNLASVDKQLYRDLQKLEAQGFLKKERMGKLLNYSLSLSGQELLKQRNEAKRPTQDLSEVVVHKADSDMNRSPAQSEEVLYKERCEGYLKMWEEVAKRVPAPPILYKV